MNKISEFLAGILKYCIGLLLIVFIISSIAFMPKLQLDNFSVSLTVALLVSITTGTFVIFSKIRHKVKIAILLAIAFILRVFWIMNVNTLPVSDFSNMYDSAKFLIEGNLDAFRDYNYLARFPHLVPMTLYMSLMIKLFPVYNLFAMKIVNIVLNVLTIYLVYRFSDFFIKSEKNRLFALLIGGVFPAFIAYSSVLCSENLALPLYLLTMITFYKATLKNDIKLYFIAGMLLSVSNLFRGVAAVFIIAFIIYIFMCVADNKFKNMFTLLGGYIVIVLAVNGILLTSGIVEKPLWDAAEPSSITLLLKGTNVNSGGRWSVEDAEFVEKYLRNDNFKKICINEILNRFESMSFIDMVAFYSTKAVSQWSIGDFAGTYWAFEGTNAPYGETLPTVFQIIYIIVLIFSVFSILSKRNNTLNYLLLFGTGLLFLIIETQPRYSYIISWILIVLATIGIEVICDFIQKGKLNVKKG